MRSICSIILLISIFGLYANKEESKTIVWFEGSSYYKALNTKKKATVYFDKWDPSIDQYLSDPGYKVAFHLDRRMDPLPEDDTELFPIEYLAAIDDDSLRNSYLSFLRDYGRTKGFNYLVLPDTVGFSRYEKEVIQSAIDLYPYYFISAHHLAKEFPSSKKELDHVQSAIWIMDQTQDPRLLSKWNKKIVRQYHQSFYNGLIKSSKEGYDTTSNIPERFFHSFFVKGTSVVDPLQLFPLRDTAIVYLGEDPLLKERLSKYVKVYDRPQVRDYPVILDNRNEKKRIFGNEIVIDFLGKESQGGKATLLVAGSCQDEDIIIAKMLFGAEAVLGRTEIPGGRIIPSYSFLGYSDPDKVGLNKLELERIDSVVEEAIRMYATPGCQVAVAKGGSIVLEKAFGYYTYDSLKQLTDKALFDVASVTKVVATLPAVALLIDQGKISLDDSIGQYLPTFASSNKSGITIRELLAHNGGIRSYIPFWRMALDGDRLDPFYYQSEEDEEADIRTYGLEPHPALKDSLKSWIVKSNLIKDPTQYNYSDVGFMILHVLVESVSGMPFDQFLAENFYDPMGLRLTFNPVDKGFTYEDIAPTEYDERYRNGQIWGEVHDRNAHIFGGVSGHAGLFANASDLARMMYLFENGGYYGGKQYLSKKTLDTFNHRHFEDNRRGLGWDKKDGEKDAASSLASDASFGHTGFTGTMVWADPEQDLIYVFLSNRIYPDALNTKLLQLNTRTAIHHVIYESLLSE